MADDNYVWAVDPGKVTGIAWRSPTGWFGSDELAPTDALDRLYQHAERGDLVAYETYAVNSHTAKFSRQYDALETIGAVKYIGHMLGLRVIAQSPGQRKAVGLHVLDKLSWRNNSPDGHANDAARHLVVACIKDNVLATDVLL